MAFPLLDEESRRLIVASGIFDADWYVTRYPDVLSTGMEPLQHYLSYGVALRRSPGPEFDPLFYQQKNAEIAGADGATVLMHYLSVGRSLSVCGSGWTDSITESSRLTATPWYLAGHLDNASGDTITGWALDRRSPDDHVWLELWIDGFWVSDLRTTMPRTDAGGKEGGGSSAGFSMRVPPGTLRAGQCVEVRFKECGALLPGAPVNYTSPKARGELPLPVFVSACRNGRIRSTTIIIPVYNAPAAVEGCLESIATYQLPAGTRVLMVNDASTDPAIAPLLAKYVELYGFDLLENKQNLGYTRTINKAISFCPDDDVVLLNSDTVVTERWLHNIQYSAYSQPDVGTVTPLSDNAGAFSVPRIGVDNPRPPHLDRSTMARAIVQTGSGTPFDVPTGNGFCLFLRRDVLDRVGLFDEDSFPRGYGEENDLCMRIMHAGWRNVVCDKAFVFHLRTQSFGAQKEGLVREGSIRLSALHPEYSGLTSRFNDLQFNLLRSQISHALASTSQSDTGPLRRALFVLSTTTGGTPQTNLDLMRAIDWRFDSFLLRCDGSQIVLSRLVDGELTVVETRQLHFRIGQVPHRSEEYDRIVCDLLFRYSVELVHIRHIAWHSLGLSSVAKMLGLPVVFSFHDFYTLCPSVNLLDTENRYRGVAIEGDRPSPLWNNQIMPAAFLPRWREMMLAFLRDCDAFVTTSQSAASLIQEVYPEAAGRMTVIPHGRDFATFDRVSASQRMQGSTPKLRVLVPGNIGPSKGALLIEAIAGMAGDVLEFHFLGRVAPNLAPIGIHHGEYSREEFAAKVRQIAPDIGVILSVWPETYCHTLTEMWASGLPVLALDLGAVGERIEASGAGWLCPLDSSPEDVLRRLEEIRWDEADREEKIRCVQAWQKSVGIVDNITAMGFRYRELYAKLMGSSDRSPLKIGLVLKGSASKGHPPTAHIRLLRPLRLLEQQGQALTRVVSCDEVIAGGATGLDLVVVQRDAIRPDRVGAVLSALESRRIPLVFEIDDLLWDIPATHTDHEINADVIDGMDSVAKAASLITTSTEALAERLRERYARPVEVVNNALDEQLWRAELDPKWVDGVCGRLGLIGNRRRILYMGSDSHARDLDMLNSVLERIRTRFPDVQILQIGGGHPLSYARTLRRPPGATSYPGFVRWFRAIASRCSLALAPLLEDDFSAAKSNIKYLDYMAAGLFGIYSDVPAYRGSVTEGVTGVLCPNEPAEWEKCIVRQLESPASPFLTATDAWMREVNSATISGSGQYWRWLQALQSALRQG